MLDVTRDQLRLFFPFSQIRCILSGGKAIDSMIS